MSTTATSIESVIPNIVVFKDGKDYYVDILTNGTTITATLKGKDDFDTMIELGFKDATEETPSDQ